MSRIGKLPVELPADVTVTIEGDKLTVKGTKGELAYLIHPDIEVKLEERQLKVKPIKESRQAKALWGTTRARINNLVTGVTQGYRKELELHGVGYRAVLKGQVLEMSLGFSHLVKIEAPTGINFTVKENVIAIEGVDKVMVGQMAAKIRDKRKPEPYKGKGVRYKDEQIRRKAGKVVGSTS